MACAAAEWLSGRPRAGVSTGRPILEPRQGRSLRRPLQLHARRAPHAGDDGRGPLVPPVSRLAEEPSACRPASVTCRRTTCLARVARHLLLVLRHPSHAQHGRPLLGDLEPPHRKLLVDLQRTDGATPAVGTPRPLLHHRRPPLQTSLAICCLEVYYRYLPMYKSDAVEKRRGNEGCRKPSDEGRKE